MTDREKEIVKGLNHSLYTVEYLEEWINRNDNVFVNAPAALQAMSAKGYYEAVKRMAARKPPQMTGREAAGNGKSRSRGKTEFRHHGSSTNKKVYELRRRNHGKRFKAEQRTV